MKNRCPWPGNDPLYIEYHDNEWGVPVHDDNKLFEMLLLESFQAGLSWITILRKRGNFRKAFSNFNYKKIAKYTQEDIERLMHDEGIIRNHLKIRSAIKNAELFMQIQKEHGSFDKYLWSHTDNKSVINHPKSMGDVQATSPVSDAIAKDLKKRGFKFTGSTVIYAYMQAIGMVDDHLEDCWKKIKKK